MNIFKLKITSDFIVNSLSTITLGVGIAEYTSNTFLSDKIVKYFKEAYKNGQPVVLSESLRKRYSDVIHDINHTDFQKAFSTPFRADGFKPVNVGCLNTRNGCYIGIPSIYDFKSIDDISSQNVENGELLKILQLINNNDTKYGQHFMESLILSESAKKFSIARELILTDNFRILVKSLLPTLTLMPMYVLGHVVLSSLPSNQMKIRVLAFILLCNIGVFIYFLARNIIENRYQNNADIDACNIGIEYIHGGIEYYEKLIQRNLALRNIIPGGEKIYSEGGDEIGFISVLSELPLTYRKKKLEQILNNSKNQENETL